MPYYVRLKPYDKSKGFTCRRYITHGVLFEGGKWMKLAKDAARELAKHTQPGSRPHVPIPLFDIAPNRKAALAMDRKAIPQTEVDGAVAVTEMRALPVDNLAADDGELDFDRALAVEKARMALEQAEAVAAEGAQADAQALAQLETQDLPTVAAAAETAAPEDESKADADARARMRPRK